MVAVGIVGSDVAARTGAKGGGKCMTNIERYDYAFDPDGEEWAARLLRRVPPDGGSVLELGPGPGAMTRVLLARGYRVTVVENDPEALEVLKTLDVEVIPGNLDSTDWLDALKGRQFDTVMACDVLEHLRKPEDVLQRLSEFVAPMGCLLISVPNIAYAGVLASMRSGIFDYSDKGQLDRTHVRFFTKRSIEKMLLDCGWAPRVWEANRVPVECSEFAGYWSALSGDQRQALLAGWQDFDVYQWMVVVTPSVDAPTWELKEARGMAESLRDELQALTVLHQRERASLLEHQKAFAEAKDGRAERSRMAQPLAQAHGLASQPVNMTDMLLGIPAFTASHAGVDRMGAECRIDPSVSVMRFGQRSDVLCLADGVSIYAQTRLVLGDVVADPCVGIRIGARTIVNVGGYLSGEGGLEIGEDVLIGPHAKLLSAGHAIDGGDVVIARNRITRARIVVEDGAWIGAGAIVLEGVTIGRGAVVAAGALVRQDVPAGMVAAGMPARLIRSRRGDAWPEPEPEAAASWLQQVGAGLKSFFREGREVK